MGALKVENSDSKEFCKTERGLSRFSFLKYAIGICGAGLAIALVSYVSTSRSNSAESVLRNYLKATTWEERLKYVKKPELVRPLMAEWYKGVDLSGGRPFLRLETEHGKNSQTLKAGDWINVRAVFNEGQNAFGVMVQDDRTYPLQLTNSGFKIDWEAAAGYNPMKFKAMNAQKPTNVQKIRVTAELADYYNYEFRDLQDFAYSIQLHEPFSNETVYGYIKKDSKDGSKLYEVLKDGQMHPMILKIRYPKFSTGSGQVIIDEFVQEHFNEP